MENPKNLPHHQRQEFCLTRPEYRRGKKLTAVKVFTVNDESIYILIQGIPALDLSKEMLSLCSKFGKVAAHKILVNYPDKEEFTDVILVKFQEIKNARKAKISLDNKSFYGGCLHVCYAPEYESVNDTRLKLQDRRKTIAYRCRTIGGMLCYVEQRQSSSQNDDRVDNEPPQKKSRNS